MKQLYLGIMSGTSLDGVDVALVRFEEQLTLPPAYRLENFLSVPFDGGMRKRLFRACAGELSMRDLFLLDADLGRLYADASLLCLEGAGVGPDEVEAIGLHGQTVWHAPKGDPVGVTVQIGSAALLAELTGCAVVSDFRSADVAAGGEGAPLVPIFDLLYLGSTEADRALVNIGGISNLTWIRRQSTDIPDLDPGHDRAVAFDSGPGNMLIDAAMRRLFERDYDAGGSVARSGSVHQPLLQQLLSEPWLRSALPKSTGRELFGEERGYQIVRDGGKLGLSPEDIVATLTEFTAATLVDAIATYCPGANDGESVELIVGGGGARNHYLMERIAARSSEQTKVLSSDETGLASDAKEAICFALLAYLRVRNLPGNVPWVTGARGTRVLGTVRNPMAS